MYSVFDDKGYMSLKFNTIKDVEKCAEDWRDDYMGNGVDFDSHVLIVEWDADEDDFEEIKRWNIEIDIEKHNLEGHPSDNGYDFEFWAKWTNPYESNRYKELWEHEKSVRYRMMNEIINKSNSLDNVNAIPNGAISKSK